MENKFVYIVTGTTPVDEFTWTETVGQYVEDILSRAENFDDDPYDTTIYQVTKFDLATGKQLEFDELEYNIFSAYAKENNYPYFNSHRFITLKRIKGANEEDFYEE